MPLDAARGGRDRGRAVGRGELVPVSKAAHVTHLTYDPRGDQRTHAMHLDQRRARGLGRPLDAQGHVRDLLREALKVGRCRPLHRIGWPG